MGIVEIEEVKEEDNELLINPGESTLVIRDFDENLKDEMTN